MGDPAFRVLTDGPAFFAAQQHVVVVMPGSREARNRREPADTAKDLLVSACAGHGLWWTPLGYRLEKLSENAARRGSPRWAARVNRPSALCEYTLPRFRHRGDGQQRSTGSALMLGSIYVGRGQMNEHPRRGARRYVLPALIAMAALIAVGAAFAHGKQARSTQEGGSEKNFRALLLPVPHDAQADKGSTVLGITKIELKDNQKIEVGLLATGLSPMLPHAIHIHGLNEARNECPRMEARNDGSTMPGSKTDGLIDVIEGLP